MLLMPCLPEKTSMQVQENRQNTGETRTSLQLILQKHMHHENYVFSPQNLGDSINTAESEYFPSLSIEGNKFIFTRLINNRNEDFYGSIKDRNGWRKAVPLKGGINTSENEGAQNVSQDGTWLLFTGCYRPDGYGSCDIYMSLYIGQWMERSLLIWGKILIRINGNRNLLFHQIKEIYILPAGGLVVMAEVIFMFHTFTTKW